MHPFLSDADADHVGIAVLRRSGRRDSEQQSIFVDIPPESGESLFQSDVTRSPLSRG